MKNIYFYSQSIGLHIDTLTYMYHKQKYWVRKKKKVVPVICEGMTVPVLIRGIPLKSREEEGSFVLEKVGFPPLENQYFSMSQIPNKPC